MAAFYRYSCLWHGCGKQCGSLLDLIDHIELVHIEKDQRILEKQESSPPAALPLSYINCFFTEAARRAQQKEQEQINDTSSSNTELGIKKKRPTPPKMTFHTISNSEAFEIGDEDGNMSDKSDESWSSDQSFPSDFILNAQVALDEGEGKRYICPVAGCGKRYKNVNGIKYHAKNGHKKEHRAKKAHKCHCGKSYKSPSGLRNHMQSQHSSLTTLPH